MGYLSNYYLLAPKSLSPNCFAVLEMGCVIIFPLPFGTIRGFGNRGCGRIWDGIGEEGVSLPGFGVLFFLFFFL